MMQMLVNITKIMPLLYMASMSRILI